MHSRAAKKVRTVKKVLTLRQRPPFDSNYLSSGPHSVAGTKYTHTHPPADLIK